MGHARWNDADWDRYAAGLKGRGRADIFRSRQLAREFDPARIDVRESRDSTHNPAATPIVVALDVTGSMGHLAELLVREGVAELMGELLGGPVSDPHLLVMGVGDAWCDAAPLQATQFEADLRIVEQMSRIWIEGGGGGNGEESYILPWAFAAAKTSCDAIESGRAKGLLVTVGDDAPPAALLREHAARIGLGLARDMDARDLLALVSREWEVFHLMIEEGGSMRGASGDAVRGAWRALLGERAIAVADHREMPRLIAGLAERCAGSRPETGDRPDEGSPLHRERRGGRSDTARTTGSGRATGSGSGRATSPGAMRRFAARLMPPTDPYGR